MSNTRCPNCGQRWDLGSRLFAPDEQCTCEHRNEPVDFLLETGGAFDWITPAAQLTAEFLKDAGKVTVVAVENNDTFAPAGLTIVGPPLHARLLNALLKRFFG